MKEPGMVLGVVVLAVLGFGAATYRSCQGPSPSHVVLDGECYETEGSVKGGWGVTDWIRLRDGQSLTIGDHPRVFGWGNCPEGE